jgi:hypothetical protein
MAVLIAAGPPVDRGAFHGSALSILRGGYELRLRGVGSVIIRQSDVTPPVFDIRKPSVSSVLFRVTRLRTYLLYPSSPHPSLSYSFFSSYSFTTLFSRDSFLTPFVMNPIQIYVVAAGGTFLLLALVHLLPYAIPFFTRLSLFISKHLTYPYVLHRHHILGPWTRAGVAMQLTYLAVNVFCVAVFYLSWHGLRASTFAC